MVDAAALGYRQRMHQPHRVRVAEIEALQPLGHDDRVPAIGGEVQVVRVLDRNRAPGTGGARVDRREAVAEVVVHVQRPQVVRRRDVLGKRADRELRDDFQRPLADHVDGVAQAVRHVHERRIAADDRTEVSGRVGAVHVHDPAGDRRPGRRGATARARASSVDVPDDVLARWRVEPQPAGSSAPARGAGQRGTGAAPAGRLGTLTGKATSVASPGEDPPKPGVRLSTRRRAPSRPPPRLGSPPSAVATTPGHAPRCAGRVGLRERRHDDIEHRGARSRRVPRRRRSDTARRLRAPARPATLVYRSRYQLPAPLKDPAFAVLGAGRFALLGGLDSSEVSSAGIEVADLHGVLRTASLPLAQHDAQGALLGGRVYVFGGGSSSELDHIVSFDPAARGRAARWARCRGPSPTSR